MRGGVACSDSDGGGTVSHNDAISTGRRDAPWRECDEDDDDEDEDSVGGYGATAPESLPPRDDVTVTAD